MLMLVIAVAVISMLGTSILAVTLMNYKIKLANTEMKEAFYLSESGLDNAYANAYELIVDAVEEADKEAQDFIESFTPEKMLDLIELGDTAYLLPKTLDEDIVYSYDENEIQKDAKIKFETVYKNFILAEEDYHDKDNIADILRNASDVDLIVDVINEPLLFSGNSMIVEIESEYTSDKGIRKTTSVSLLVDVPKYNESYTVVTKKVDVNPFWLKALAARNLNIESSSIFKGDVYVEENLNVNSSGINPKFHNVLAVRGYTSTADERDENKGIRLNAFSTTNVSDVYAKNILLTVSGAKLRADTAGSKLYVRDDLEIKSSNHIVYINGSYWGFSDGSIYGTADSSSGININETTGLSFTITENLYLNGTSYIDVVNSSGKKYQTGESLSVKGNYRAYLQPLLNYSPSDGGSDLRNVGFADYGHLRLADNLGYGIPLIYSHKADYIYYYQSEYGGLDTAGININGNTMTLGSSISGGVLKKASYDPINPTDRANADFEGAKYKYLMHTERLGYDKDVNNNLISASLTFSNQINDNLTAMTSQEINDINNDDPLNYIYINNSTGDIKPLTEESYKGLIITNGNLVIDSSVKSFEGAIICGGTVTIKGGVKTFKYNKNLVSKIISDKDLHKSIFAGKMSVEKIDITTFEADEGGNTDFTNLLSFKNWKIK